MVQAYAWGAYRALAHLFPVGQVCVMSKCGKAYVGETGVIVNTKRRKCKYCVALDSKSK